MKTYKQLLSISADSKTIKGEKQGYLTGILYLSPYKLSGKNFCSFATKGCIASCLNTAGRGKFNSVQTARYNKSRYFIEDRTEFMLDLVESIIRLKKKAENKGLIPVVRLNGTADLLWENITITRENLITRRYILNNISYLKPTYGTTTNIMDLFSDTRFYDYTKNPFRTNLPSNYKITFSKAETNQEHVLIALDRGLNVAVVFDSLPSEYLGRKVINGDLSDLRFNDPKNVIVGLIAKGSAKQDNSGFVVKS